MTDTASQHPSVWKDKFAILEEAIEACGGLEADAVASVHNYITCQYPNFPWQENWYGQIVSARCRLRQATAVADATCAEDRPATPGDSQTTAGSGIVRYNDIERARVFIERLGRGSIPQAQEALEFIEDFGSLERMAPAIETWNELLEAVGHDEGVADRALQVIVSRMTSAGPSLKIADSSTEILRSDAA